MDLVGLLVGLLIVGLVWWLIDYLPIPPPFKMVAHIVLVVFIIIWLLSFIGVVGPFYTRRMG